MKFSILAVIAAPILVSAQYGAPPDSSSSAPAASSAAASAAPAVPSSSGAGNQVVTVGANNALMFSPNNITANEGDTITFAFVQPQGFMHSVTQSNGTDPCTPLAGGFNSGLRNPGDQFTIKITNASRAIWFYCENDKPLKHCGMGMAGGINVGKSNITIDAFVNAAKSIGNNELAQTASPALSGVGAVATAPAGPAGSGSGSSSGSAPSSSPTGGAEKLAVGAGSLMATLLALFALA